MHDMKSDRRSPYPPAVYKFWSTSIFQRANSYAALILSPPE